MSVHRVSAVWAICEEKRVQESTFQSGLDRIILEPASVYCRTALAAWLAPIGSMPRPVHPRPRRRSAASAGVCRAVYAMSRHNVGYGALKITDE
jgi:hypothetical protein